MADYFAVLNRTLSGFSDPKPALREKLYERARVTITRQLEMRRPTIDDAFIAGELAKLEEAITRIETGFDGAAVPAAEPVPAGETPEPSQSVAEPSEPASSDEMEGAKAEPAADGPAENGPAENGPAEDLAAPQMDAEDPPEEVDQATTAEDPSPAIVAEPPAPPAPKTEAEPEPEPEPEPVPEPEPEPEPESAPLRQDAPDETPAAEAADEPADSPFISEAKAGTSEPQAAVEDEPNNVPEPDAPEDLADSEPDLPAMPDLPPEPETVELSVLENVEPEPSLLEAEVSDVSVSANPAPESDAPHMTQEPVAFEPESVVPEDSVDDVSVSEAVTEDAEPLAETDMPVFDRAADPTSLRAILSDNSGDDTALDAVDAELEPAEARMFEPQMPVGEPEGNFDSQVALPTNEADFETAAVLANATEATTPNAGAQPDPAVTDAQAVEAWADEFLAMQNGETQLDAPEPDPETAPAVEPAHASDTTQDDDPDAILNRLSNTVDSLIASSDPALTPDDGAAPALDSTVGPAVAGAAGLTRRVDSVDLASPTEDVPPMPSVERDTPLTIPPAPVLAPKAKADVGKRKKSGWGKWLALVLLSLLFLLALLMFVPQASSMRDGLIRSLGLENTLGAYFSDPAVRPKPVKTITITPPEDEPAEAATPETIVPFEKREERLTEDGTEIAPDPVVPPSQVIEPAANLTPTPAPEAGTAGADAAPQGDADQGASAPSLPDGPSALLYEEATASGQNSVDAGVVRWSLSEESIDGGAPEPVINGRMEVPGRDLVLLLTVKRNLDPALSASHLIELIFAVPDDFAGGAITEMNRFVMKESEQSRGDNLVGVPVKLADGLFMLALNNLDQAKETNFNLLTTRGWIDIPLQYRNGRRALVTLEKGAEGTRVFSEAFDAWSKL